MENVLKKSQAETEQTVATTSPVVLPPPPPRDLIQQKYISFQTSPNRTRTRHHSVTAKKISRPAGTLSQHVRYLPLVFFGLCVYGVLFWIFTHLYPNDVEHFLLPNSFLPVIFLFAVGNFCFITYATSDTPIGFFGAMWSAVLAFLYLQHFTSLMSYALASLPFLVIGVIQLVGRHFGHHD